MTDLLDLKPHHKVLEIGTGSGYQAAVLAALDTRVWSIEIIEPLGQQAKSRLQRLGFDTVEVRIGDGYYAWATIVCSAAKATATMAGRSMHRLMQSSLPPPRTIFHRPW